MTSTSRDLIHEEAQELQVSLTRLVRLMRQHAAGGLTPSQASALATIAQHGPLRLSQLAERESVGAPTATRVVAYLEELGYVERTEDPEDRRASRVAVSKVGLATMERIWSDRTEGLSRRLAELAPKENDLLRAALPVLARLAAEHPAG